MVAALAVLASSQSFASCGDGPAVVAKEFYGAYISSWITGDAIDVYPYADRKLVDRLNALENSESPDSDYFLKAQDYFDDWPQSVSVTEASKTDSQALELVKLGTTPESEVKLKVYFEKQHDCWMIVKVEAG